MNVPYKLTCKAFIPTKRSSLDSNAFNAFPAHPEPGTILAASKYSGGCRSGSYPHHSLLVALPVDTSMLVEHEVVSSQETECIISGVTTYGAHPSGVGGYSDHISESARIYFR